MLQNMEERQPSRENTLDNTVRVETFSDGVYAIVATLLVLELRVPVLSVINSTEFLHALRDLVPEFIAFAVSFFTVGIYWVNHHYFFHGVQKSDWKLLWSNNHHLFWIATIPFTTQIVGKYHTLKWAVGIYGFDMALAALSIMMMIHYVFFHSKLMYPGFPEERKRSEFRRGMRGVYLYFIASALAFINVYIALAIFIIVPLMYVIPGLLNDHSEINL